MESELISEMGETLVLNLWFSRLLHVVVGYQQLGEPCCLHCQGGSVRLAIVWANIQYWRNRA